MRDLSEIERPSYWDVENAIQVAIAPFERNGAVTRVYPFWEFKVGGKTPSAYAIRIGDPDAEVLDVELFGEHGPELLGPLLYAIEKLGILHNEKLPKGLACLLILNTNAWGVAHTHRYAPVFNKKGGIIAFADPNREWDAKPIDNPIARDLADIANPRKIDWLNDAYDKLRFAGFVAKHILRHRSVQRGWNVVKVGMLAGQADDPFATQYVSPNPTPTRVVIEQVLSDPELVPSCTRLLKFTAHHVGMGGFAEETSLLDSRPGNTEYTQAKYLWGTGSRIESIHGKETLTTVAHGIIEPHVREVAARLLNCKAVTRCAEYGAHPLMRTAWGVKKRHCAVRHLDPDSPAAEQTKREMFEVFFPGGSRGKLWREKIVHSHMSGFYRGLEIHKADPFLERCP